MAGDEDCDRIDSVGHAYGSTGFGMSDLFGYFFIASRFSEGDGL